MFRSASFHPYRRFCIALLLLLPALAVSAQQALPSPEPGFSLPADPAFRADALDAELAALQTRLERAVTALASTSLDDLQLLGEEHPDRIRENNVLEFAVLATPRDVQAWSRLYEQRAEHGVQDAALGAAWRIYTLSGAGRPRAVALLRLADVYAAMAQPTVARNIAAMAVQADASEDTLTAYEALAARLRLHITELSVEAEQTLPRACVTLSRQLAVNQPIPLDDLVTLRPGVDALVSAQGDRLCVAGLAHGTRYTLTLHPGLTSGDGETLASPLTRDIDVPHREPSVAFAAGAYVLPRAARSLLPVRTVNLSEVPLELFRVDDRNLVGTTLANLVRQPLSSWDRARLAGTLGARVWQGVLDVERVDDREVVTNIAIDQLLGADEPGVYALSAPLPDNYRNAATQWLVVSDLGLTTFAARDGLHLFVRSLADSMPRANVELTLVATNNRILATARTDADGYLRFAPGLVSGSGGDAPAAITAHAGNDYNFLLLDGPALDLAERGVAGRTPPGAADAYLYTERGIYRPGETVQLSVLLRDANGTAMPGLPLNVRVLRPGGVVVAERVLTIDTLGAAHLAVPLSEVAETGLWSVQARLDPAGATVGATSFQVEDFVPPRIEVQAEVERARLQPGASEKVQVDARFYYGAPAAELAVDGRLRVEPDPAPFADWPRFVFGREELEFSPVSLPLATARTDATGRVALNVPMPVIADRSQPLRARITAAVHDVGGRPVYHTVSAAIELHPRYVGIRAATDAVADGEPAEFELLVVDPDGTPVPGHAIRWQWVREHYDYTWFVSNGRWNWRESVTDETLAGETAVTGTDGRATITRSLPPGRYRLDLDDADGSASASRRFHVGWWRGAAAANVPDALELTLGPATGNRRTAFIDAPFAGRALVTLGNERLQRHFEIELPEGGREVSFEVLPEWSPGLYLMVTAFRPGGGAPSPLPSRAMGLAWLPVGVAERTLQVVFDTPAESRPRQTVSVPVSIAGAAGERLGLSVAAVDEGVLALTGFATPDPVAHYFAQRALGADVRDVYGDLIATLDAPLGALRSGGGAAGDNLAGVSVRSSRVVALYRRDIRLDADGRGSVMLDLPDFNGRLRLMGVAWGARSLGSGSADLLVRDPLIADLVLPRFLAPGDRAEASLDLRNPGDQPLTVTVAAVGEQAVRAEFASRSLTLAAGAGQVLPVLLEGLDPGLGNITLEVTLTDGSGIRREYPLTVRAAAPNRIERRVHALGPDESLLLEATRPQGFHRGARLTVTATNGIAVDVPGMLAELIDYPYGCTEQTVSRALPQLYVDGGTESFNTVAAAIRRVLDRQRHDGRFGVWSANGRTPPWLTAYVYEFLLRARERGFEVPQAALTLTERALQEILESGQPDYAAAYAAYALAKGGRARRAVVRRFALAHGDDLSSRLAVAHTAAALALAGDREPATVLFEKALTTSRKRSLEDYGSDLRDAAALLALLVEHGDMAAHGAAVSEALERMLASGVWFSTQEEAWLLIAAVQSRAAAGPLRLEVDGTPGESADGTLTLVDGSLDAALPAVVNRTTSAVRVVSQLRGAPLAPPAPYADGYRIQRRYYDVDSGEEVEPATVSRGQSLLVMIEGQSTRQAQRQEVLVVDLLPAGFEIESLAEAGAEAELPVFVGPLSETEFANARDDRYVAALRLDGEQRFRLAYRVRAITRGDFALPGVQVEDMYLPRFRANGAAARTRVVDGG